MKETSDKELKITEERVKAAAEKCGTAKEILKELFPAVFEKKEEWYDATREFTVASGVMAAGGGLYLCHNNNYPIFIKQAVITLDSHEADELKIEDGKIWRKRGA